MGDFDCWWAAALAFPLIVLIAYRALGFLWWTITKGKMGPMP